MASRSIGTDVLVVWEALLVLGMSSASGVDDRKARDALFRASLYSILEIVESELQYA